MMISCFNIAETGGIAICPLPQSEKRPGFIMKPFFGVEPVLLDDNASAKSVTIRLIDTICFHKPRYTNVPAYK